VETPGSYWFFLLNSVVFSSVGLIAVFFGKIMVDADEWAQRFVGSLCQRRLCDVALSSPWRSECTLDNTLALCVLFSVFLFPFWIP
jgi:hypothetical protein